MWKPALALVTAIFSVGVTFAQPDRLVIHGKVVDERNDALAYAHVRIPSRGLGTASNAWGLFTLKLPAECRHDSLLISYLGFEPRHVAIAAFRENEPLVITLYSKPLALNEVVVEAEDPVKLIRLAIQNISRNYHSSPHVTRGFYRIDTRKDGTHIQLSEAVFDIFNYGYGVKEKNQFKLLRTRAIKDEKACHGLDLGLKPGSVSAFDIVSQIHTSDIFSEKNLKKYAFELEGVTDYEGKQAYEITFNQKDGQKESLYQGTIYLDVNSLAFLCFEFSRSSKGIAYAKFGDAGTRALMKIIGLAIDIEQEAYRVKYEKYGEKWGLSSVRNDVVLNFKSDRDHFDFAGHTVVDYVVTGTDTLQKIPFNADDVLGNNKLIEFQTTDPDSVFWKDYNIMLADYDWHEVAATIQHKNSTYNLKSKIEAGIAKLPGNKAVRIDSILSFYHREGEFNGVALVKAGGNVILRKSYGLANKEEGTPHSVNSQFRIGSLTKTFTSMIIQQLNEEGKLTLDDPVRKYIPGYIHGDVTIAQLLTHSSGIPNYTNNHNYLTQILTREIALKKIVTDFCSDSLEFTSGKKFRYSNSGYVLLALIIEIVTGDTYGQALKNRVFDPLHMLQTSFAADSLNTSGYLYDRPEPGYPAANVAGAGGISSTADDLLTWDESLYGSDLLPPDKMEELFTPRTVYSDWDAYYGYGWMIDRFLFKESKKHLIIYHPGTDFGYYTMFARQPDRNNLIVLLNNTGDFPRFDITDLILEIIN